MVLIKQGNALSIGLWADQFEASTFPARVTYGLSRGGWGGGGGGENLNRKCPAFPTEYKYLIFMWNCLKVKSSLYRVNGSKEKVCDV